MPIPIILALAAAIGGATTIYGACELKDANNILKAAEERHKKNIRRYKSAQKEVDHEMGELGTLIMEICYSFRYFSGLYQAIHNRPEFEKINLDDTPLPSLDLQRLSETGVGGVPVMALGAAIIGGLFLGGIVLSITGASKVEKAKKAQKEVERAEENINKVCAFLAETKLLSVEYRESLGRIKKVYDEHIMFLEGLIQKKTDWTLFSAREKKKVENLVKLAKLLYFMCKKELLLKNKNDEELGTLNKVEIETQIREADMILEEIRVA